MKTNIIIFILTLLLSQITIGQQFSYISNNPFGLQYSNEYSERLLGKLIFYDIDSDSDLDAILVGMDSINVSSGQIFDNVKYFIEIQENIGSKLQPSFAPRKPFMNKFPYPDGYFAPAIGDLNQDGLPDFMVCCGVDSSLNLKPQFYERKSITGDGQFMIMDSDSLRLRNFSRGGLFLPELADMDMDGDLDLVMSGFNSELNENLRRERKFTYLYAKNIGSLNQPIFDGWYPNPYGLTPADFPQYSVIGDIDNDNDNDILSLIKKDYIGVPGNLGFFSFIENIPQTDGKPHFLTGVEFPFGLPIANETETLYGHSLVDIDADGDLDLFVIQKLMGSEIGIGYYENNLCLTNSIHLSQNICDGDSAMIGNQVFKTTGEYFVSHENAQHCDSTVHLSLAVFPSVQQNLSEVICPGESYIVDSQSFTQTGQYQINLFTSNGCDSTIHLNLTVDPLTSTNLTASVCEGEGYNIGTQTFNQTGQFVVTLSNVNGCDSIVNLGLTVFPKSSTNLTISVCEGESATVGTQTFNQTGQYTVTLSNINGCDSMVHLDLKVNPAATTNLVKTLCSGSSFVIGTQSFTQSGQYEVKLKTILGCDSIVNAALTFISLDSTVTESQNGLTSNQNGAQYQWFDCANNTDINGATGQTFTPTKNGTYGVRITDANNCQISSACFNFVLSSIEELLISNQITLFPNPTADYFTLVNNTGYALTDIIILNNAGQIVKKISKTQTERINTAGLLSGNYIIEMVCNGRKINKKLIVFSK